MRVRIAMAACLALALPTLSPAVENEREAPQPSHTAPGASLLTAADLGGLFSAVEFCENIAPNQGEQLRKNAKHLMKGLSEDKIETMKRTPEFKNAYSTISGILKGVPKDQDVQLCTLLEQAV